MDKVFWEEEKCNGWRDYYFDLRKRSSMDAFEKSTKAAIANRRYNRYSDVLPYDDNRVVLSGKDTNVDYINASIISFDETGQKYIMTQGPLDSTRHHFWSMVWERDLHSIVMLCKTFENQKSKCSQYWPIKASIPRSFEQFTVSLESCCQSSEYNISSLILTYNDGKSPPQQRKITHFHYHAWPDFGIPDSPDSFLKFLCLVRQQNPESSPPLIHCSAGIGRSGVYAVCDIMIRLFQNLPPQQWPNISLDDVLLKLRLQRMGLIQAPDQLRFTFKAILRAKELIEMTQWPQFFLPTPDEEMPPPPPPLRTESLNSSEGATDWEPSSITKLLEEPELLITTSNGDTMPNNTKTVSAEVRQRKKQETADKVAEIKSKMKQTERSQEFWQKYLPHIVGIGIFVLGSCVYIYFRNSGTGNSAA